MIALIKGQGIAGIAEQAVVAYPGSVHFVDGETVYASRGNAIFRSQDGGKRWTELLRLPLSWYEYLQSATRLSRRLFRSGIHHLVPGHDGSLVIVGFGKIFVYNTGRGQLHANPSTIQGSRPLALCDAGRGRWYYGEYRGTWGRGSVHVWGSYDGGRYWEPVFRFDSVGHIHGVYQDPFTGASWVTTGDEDAESGIFVTEDDFKTVEQVVSGSQQFRAIRLLFTQNHVYFGSDTLHEKNHIYRIIRRTGQIETLQRVEGSVFHGGYAGSRLFFSTACEPSIVNTTRLAMVWMSEGGEDWRVVASFQKDPWHPKLFQYGQVFFPAGPGVSDHIWLTPFATVHDQTSFKLSLETVS